MENYEKNISWDFNMFFSGEYGRFGRNKRVDLKGECEAHAEIPWATPVDY
jgi:hypothetical protein